MGVRHRQLVRYTVVHGHAREGPRGRDCRECGNPAVVGARRELRCVPVDRWLCVPAFRRVCRYHFLLLPGLINTPGMRRAARSKRGRHGTGEKDDSQLGEKSWPATPLSPACAVRTGGFASPSFDGYALVTLCFSDGPGSHRKLSLNRTSLECELNVAFMFLQLSVRTDSARAESSLRIHITASKSRRTRRCRNKAIAVLRSGTSTQTASG